MPVILAVSGGVDSVAMLHAVRRCLPDGLERRLVVAHAEHDLRGDASADREFVAELAGHLGVPFHWRRIDVGHAAEGEGIEARARRLRYDFLRDTALDQGARYVLLAHTADDQAETILHRVLRGTGLSGLGGMRRARELCPGVSLLRPLLEMRRHEGMAYLEGLGLIWRDDATNADTRFSRNHLRHRVLPTCVEGPYPAAVESLVRLGRQASVVADALRSAADALLETHSTRRPDGTIEIQTTDLAGLDPHLVAEVFVALWRRERWPQRDMTAAHYEALASMVAATRTTQNDSVVQLPSGVRATAVQSMMAIRGG